MKILFFSFACLLANVAQAEIGINDDEGNAITLQKPAQRIISMAPNITELLFAAGGGAHVVGVISYSDYPEAAKRIANIGDSRQIDLERIIALKPDLLVVWRDAGSARQLAQLRGLGIPMFFSEPRKLDDIPSSLERFGHLMNTEKVAQAAASDLRHRLAALRARYAARPVVRVFYQVWGKPLYTLNGGHIVSDAIRACGGENIFAAMKVSAPTVGVEAVLQENPEAIFGTSEHGASDSGLDMWRPFTSLTAVRHGNLFTLDADWMNRAGPRLIDGTASLCEKLDIARQRRKPGA